MTGNRLQRHRLGAVGSLLDKMKLPAPAEPDAGLSAPAAHDAFTALDQARRRGLDTAVIENLWKWFESRPVELGLFAWDVLCNALLDPDKDQLLLARLRKAARVVRDVLPEPGRAFADTSRVSAAELVDKIAVPPFRKLTPERQFELVNVNALAALEMYVAVSEPGDPELQKLLVASRKFAHYLQLAHLSTLATFYFDYLWKRGGQRQVLPDYVEAMLDADAHGHYPRKEELIVEGSIEEIELAGYMLSRDAVQLGTQHLMIPDFRKAPNPIDYQKGDPKELAKTFQRSHLVHAELFLDVDEQPVPFAVVQQVMISNPAWRYAGRVRLALFARVAPPQSQDLLKALDNFVAVFGNERWAWAETYEYAPTDAVWLPALEQRLVREVTELPHDRAAWEALGLVELLSEDSAEWLKGIAARAAEQCRLD
jgi:hypothetical protein